jgi:hypothetical protein
MPITANTPCRLIEGIGPRTAKRLRPLGLFTVSDLLRVTSRRLHAALDGYASLNQVNQWKAMAAMLHVYGMNEQWAEALARGGVDSIEELSGRRFDDLMQLLRAAKRRRWIGELPDSSRLATMMQDAMRLTLTGALNGTVVDREGQGISNATVRLGTQSAKTDRRGRFLLLRVRQPTGAPLLIEKHGLRTRQVAEPATALSLYTIQNALYRLEQGASEGPVLSELTGSEVPPFSGQPVRTERQTLESLTVGDIFMLRRFLTRSPEAILVSKFREYRDGVFVVRTYRVPRERLPDNVEERQHLELTTDGFKLFEFTPERMRRRGLIRKMERTVGARPDTRSSVEREADFERRQNFLKDHGFFGPAIRRVNQ